MKALINEILGVAGGIGIFSIVKYLSKPIMKLLSSKWNQRIENQNEQYKSDLSRKAHISKTRFDKEFEIYQELSEKNLTMVYDMGEVALATIGIIVQSPEYTHDKIEELKDKACQDLNSADFYNKKYAPFISKEIFEKYKKMTRLAQEILKLFIYFTSEDELFSKEFNFKLYGMKYHSKDEFCESIKTKQKELSALSDQILDELRDYLNTLDVKD